MKNKVTHLVEHVCLTLQHQLCILLTLHSVQAGLVGRIAERSCSATDSTLHSLNQVIPLALCSGALTIAEVIIDIVVYVLSLASTACGWSVVALDWPGRCSGRSFSSTDDISSCCEGLMDT